MAAISKIPSPSNPDDAAHIASTLSAVIVGGGTSTSTSVKVST